MPELPEVETVARQLAPLVEGRVLERVRLVDSLLRGNREARTPRGVLGGRIERVFRCGKQVVLSLECGRGGGAAAHLAVHLRMTGRLTYVGRVPRGLSAVRARLELDRGVVLFQDARRFGTLRWCRSLDEITPRGVDPTAAEFTVDRFVELIGVSRQQIKPWLLRQDKLVGLGNIYCSEILHGARVAPEREVRSLSRAETRRVHRATIAVLTKAIESCGTTFSDFQDAHGAIGSYQECLQVYGREGEPCPRCGAEITRIVQQQRSTFFCSECTR